jgi:hypothetical protein
MAGGVGMTFPSYAELRLAVQQEATRLSHPTKVVRDRRLGEKPHKYGSIVYFEGGHVGVLVKGKYLIAEGDDHQDSILALAHHIGVTQLDNKVKVAKVSAGHFWLRCAAGR